LAEAGFLAKTGRNYHHHHHHHHQFNTHECSMNIKVYAPVNHGYIFLVWLELCCVAQHGDSRERHPRRRLAVILSFCQSINQSLNGLFTSAA